MGGDQAPMNSSKPKVTQTPWLNSLNPKTKVKVLSRKVAVGRIYRNGTEIRGERSKYTHTHNFHRTNFIFKITERVIKLVTLFKKKR